MSCRSGRADIAMYICCSKLSESMQKQWQGRKGAERLEKFRAQVPPSCSCAGTSAMRTFFQLGRSAPTGVVASALCDRMRCHHGSVLQHQQLPGRRSRGGPRCAASAGRRATTSGPAMHDVKLRCACGYAHACRGCSTAQCLLASATVCLCGQAEMRMLHGPMHCCCTLRCRKSLL